MTENAPSHQAPPPPADPAAPPIPLSGSPTPEERRALIRKYQSQSLRRPDPLLANLAVLNGDLMLLALQSQEMVQDILAESTTATERQRRLGGPIERHLKIVRQVDRLAQFEKTETKAPPPAHSPKQLPAAAPPGGPAEPRE